MRRSVRSLSFLIAILLAGCLAAGCASAGSSIKSAVSSFASNTATARPPTTAASQPVAPTTAAPATTAAPPTTAAAPASAAAPAASASPTTGAGSGSSLVWLWILLGAAVVAGLIAWLTSMARRGSAKKADWRSRLIDAYAKGSALHDAMSVAETPGAMTMADGDARWADIQRRADDLAQTLYALGEDVPGPVEQTKIADTLASLQAVRSAMGAERAPGGAGPQQAEVVRSRLYAFESSLRALRGDNQPYP